MHISTSGSNTDWTAHTLVLSDAGKLYAFGSGQKVSSASSLANQWSQAKPWNLSILISVCLFNKILRGVHSFCSFFHYYTILICIYVGHTEFVVHVNILKTVGACWLNQ